MTGSHRTIDLDTELVCRRCGSAQRVSYAECTQIGRPHCCGRRMSLRRTESCAAFDAVNDDEPSGLYPKAS